MIDNDTTLFHRDGDWFHPTPLTTGPWRSDAMHGGPPAALFGLAIGDEVQDGEHVARITVELERPVPLEPLRLEATRRQVSRRVAHLDIALVTKERQVSSARALLLRAEPLPDPLWAPPAADYTPPGADHRYTWGTGQSKFDSTVFHRDACEHRVVAGGYDVPGPSRAWIRLSYPLVEGEQTTPLCALLAAADFGSALSGSLPPNTGMGVINVDISMALSRVPTGEWFLLESTGLINQAGAGLAMTQLADVDGPLGLLHQTQLGYRFAT